MFCSAKTQSKEKKYIFKVNLFFLVEVGGNVTLLQELRQTFILTISSNAKNKIKKEFEAWDTQGLFRTFILLMRPWWWVMKPQLLKPFG